MKYLLAPILFGLLIGCSDNPYNFETEDIEGIVIGEKLKVSNKSDRSIYYFAVEQETAALIDWIAISREENEIKAKDAKDILFEDVIGYEKGAKIILYYWVDDNGQAKGMKNLVIETG